MSTQQDHILRIDQAIGFALDVDTKGDTFQARRAISMTYNALRDRLQRRKGRYNHCYPNPPDVPDEKRAYMLREKAEIVRDEILLEHLLRFINNINDEGCVSFLPPEEYE